MPVFAKIAIPMSCVTSAMFYLASEKYNKNNMAPGFVLFAAGFVNTVIALAVSW